MNHPVIPAPLRFDGGNGAFLFRSGTTVAYADTAVAPVVEGFCSQVTRRTGLRLVPMTGDPGTSGPSVRVELGTGDDLGVLPAPAGVSAAGGGPADERHALAIDADQVVVRAVEPVGVARGLTTLLQLLAATPSPGNAGELALPGARVLDAPRYAWRGLSLDLARTFFTLDDVRRVVDLLALYKLNVLHLHLTDDQSWRLPVGRPAESLESDAAFYGARTCGRWPPTPPTASSPSCPRSTRPATRPRWCGCTRSCAPVATTSSSSSHPGTSTTPPGSTRSCPPPSR
jgi:hexosaminidase